MDVRAEILRCLQAVNESIRDDDQGRLLEDGLLDSFDIVNLVGDLENIFGISIEAADILPENFQTLAAIVALVEKVRREGGTHGA